MHTTHGGQPQSSNTQNGPYHVNININQKIQHPFQPYTYQTTTTATKNYIVYDAISKYKSHKQLKMHNNKSHWNVQHECTIWLCVCGLWHWNQIRVLHSLCFFFDWKFRTRIHNWYIQMNRVWVIDSSSNRKHFCFPFKISIEKKIGHQFIIKIPRSNGQNNSSALHIVLNIIWWLL